VIDDKKLSLFLMLGQSADKIVSGLRELSPAESLKISLTQDIAELTPDSLRRAIFAAEAYKLFFVFEEYLREFVVDVLSKNKSVNWWDKIPTDVKGEVEKLEETEEAKRWMALGSRNKSSLMTYPQLIKVIDDCWKEGFEELLRDKGLLQEARLLTHLRNTICHMSNVSDEEMERIKQTIRDWFRMVAP